MASRISLATLVFLGVFLVAAPSVAFAQTKTNPPSTGSSGVDAPPLDLDLPSRFEGKKLVWEDRYTRVDALQYTTLGVSAAIALAANIVQPRQTSWNTNLTGSSLDESVRDTLRLGSYTARSRARDASDVSLGVVSAFPIVVDTLIVAYWYRGSADVARQMFLIDAEAMAVTAAIQGTATWALGRARPYVRDCEKPGETDGIQCDSSSRFRSFFSGHTSQAFVSAALVCSHHLSLDLFDSSADGVACGLAMTAAAGTGALRIMGDMHYVSDVVIGAAVGTVVGFGIPWIHHYRRKDDSASVTIVPTVGGAAVVGGW